MSDKGFEGFDKMSVDVVSESKKMADFIVARVHRGPGDTIEAAMYRAEKIYGAPFEWLHRLRYRHRELRDISGSALIAIIAAYRTACEQADAAYEMERNHHAPSSALVSLADFVAGQEGATKIPSQEE